MQWKINNMVICLRMGKNLTAKSPLGDFQVTTLETPLSSQQAVTSKGILVPYTNLQLNPYPNTQLDLFCSDSSSFWCTASKYVTNQCANLRTRLQSPTKRRLLAAKFFSSSQQWRSRRCLVTKPYGAHTQQLLHKNDELRQNFVFGYKLLEQSLLNTCATYSHFDGP